MTVTLWTKCGQRYGVQPEFPGECARRSVRVGAANQNQFAGWDRVVADNPEVIGLAGQPA